VFNPEYDARWPVDGHDERELRRIEEERALMYAVQEFDLLISRFVCQNMVDPTAFVDLMECHNLLIRSIPELLDREGF
jgi:hypothetical protein